MIPDRIITPRLTLRRARETDLEAVSNFLSHPAAMRYWSTPEHASLAQTQSWLGRRIASPIESSDDFLIELQGKVIGLAGSDGLREVGFILHPDHWHQGYAHEAMVAVITHIFTHRDLPHLTADADPRNAASLGLLAKLGFVETHRIEKNLLWGDEWCDSVYFSLSRADWQARG